MHFSFVFVVVFVIQQMLLTQTALCEFNIVSHLSGMTPYADSSPGSSNNYVPPESCRLVGLDGVFRHGSRYPSRRAAASFRNLEPLLKEYNSSLLIPWMRNWRSPYDNATAELLCRRGIEEHFGLGYRHRRFFPSSTYTPENIELTSTYRERAAQSAISFANGAAHDGGRSGVHCLQETKSRDRILRFFDNCEIYQKTYKDTLGPQHEWYDRHSDSVSKNLEKVTGIPAQEWLKPLPGSERGSRSAMEAAWDACQTDYVVRNVTNEWCTLFSEMDAKFWEYYDDLEDYYTYGNGHNPRAPNINLLFASELLKDFYEHSSAAAHQKNVPFAAMRFAHAETLIPMVSLHQLFAEGEPLQGYWEWERVDRRRWMNKRVAPLATNVMWFTYECNATQETGGIAGTMVELRHNENTYSFPGCGGRRLCSLDRIRKVFAPILENDWEKTCAAV